MIYSLLVPLHILASREGEYIYIYIYMAVDGSKPDLAINLHILSNRREMTK